MGAQVLLDRPESAFGGSQRRCTAHKSVLPVAKAWPLPISFPATEQELRVHYGSNPIKIASISKSELLAHFALLPAAAGGVMFWDSQSLCEFAGSRETVGYLFDETTRRYSQVLLRVDGDGDGIDLAPEASQLFDWLTSYGQVPNDCNMAAQRYQCSGATCATPPPSCPDGEVPSVVGGCWSACVPVEQCASVSDCTKCPSSDGCVSDSTGASHCAPCATLADPCAACPGQPICAGGSAFCTKTAPDHARCGAAPPTSCTP